MTTRIGPAEVAVLCACARRRAQVTGPGPLPPNIDWDALFNAADAHGVVELLAAPLAAGTVDVPPSIREHLQRRAIEVTALNLNRATELAGLMKTLSDHGVRALGYKGITLAAGVYGHVGCRFSSDIDIFIHRDDLALLRPLLLDHGYRVAPRDPRRCESPLYGVFPAVGRVDELVSSLPGHTPIDVHVAFAIWPWGIRCDAQALFDRAITIDVAGHAIRTLCPDDLLHALAIHGLLHNWWPLRTVSDIDAVAGLVSDWDEVIRRAEAARMRRVLWVALLLSQRLLNTELPRAVAARASADAGARHIVRWAAARMFVAGPPSLFWLRRPWLRSFVPDTPAQRVGFYTRGVVYAFLKRSWNTRPAPG